MIEGKIGAIIMASGFSRRLGRNKLLLPLGKSTVIERVFDLVGEMGYEPVIVVSQYQEILDLAAHRGFIPRANPLAQEGKSRSIVEGIQVFNDLFSRGKAGNTQGIIFFTGDQALLTKELLEGLAVKFAANPQAIVFPRYGDNPGSPAIFPVSLAPCLLNLKGEEGGMKVAQESGRGFLYVEAAEAVEGQDLDTLEDYEIVKAKLGLD